MTKKKQAQFDLVIPIYDALVVVYVGYDVDYIREHIKEYEHKEFIESVEAQLEKGIPESDTGFVIQLSTLTYLFYLKRMPKAAFDKGTLGHEIAHLSFAILRQADVKLSKKSEEAFAYLHGYIEEEMYVKLGTRRRQKST